MKRRKKNLSESQQKTLDYLRLCAQEGVPPSVREIGTHVGLKSTSSVHMILRILEEQGYITRGAGQNRSIRLVGDKTVLVPVVGKVTAGIPILAVENIEGYIPCKGGGFAASGELFALRVIGDSMTGAAIIEGDIIVAEITPVAENGDIIVALIDDEATVKRLFREDGLIRLQPENPAYQPILVKEVAILGRVKACLRYY